MTIHQKKMADLFKQLEGIRLQAEKEERNLTHTEIEKRTALKKEIEALVAEEDSFKEEKELRNTLYGTGSTGPLTLCGPGEFIGGVPDNRRITAPRGKDYRSLFGLEKDRSLDRGGFGDFNEFLSVLHSGRADERLKLETRAMTTGIASSGGFIVPEDFSAWLLDSSLESEIIRPRATVWPMLAPTKKVPGWDMTSNVGSVFGGLTAEWIAESGTATEVFAKLRQISLQALKLACYTSASNELVADGVSFEEQLSGALQMTIGFYLDYSFIQGSGAGQPRGLLNDPALITVEKENGQIANTIYYENVVKMFARLAPQCMKNAVWIANQTAIPKMLTMSFPVGTGGTLAPAVTQQGGRFYLLTKEVIFTEKCPALGNKGDLIFCDPSQYSIGLRQEVSLDKSNAPGWLKDESSYRAIIRADGQGTWSGPISPKHGETISWCVALEDR